MWVFSNNRTDPNIIKQCIWTDQRIDPATSDLALHQSGGQMYWSVTESCYKWRCISSRYYIYIY